MPVYIYTYLEKGNLSYDVLVTKQATRVLAYYDLLI